MACHMYPIKGQKIEEFQDRHSGLNFSSEIENFKRAARLTLGVLSHHLKFEMKSPHLVDFG